MSVKKTLQILALSLPTAAREELKEPSDELVSILSQFALNLIKNPIIDISPQLNRQLIKFKKDLQLLANDRYRCKKKLIQKRGYKFVPALVRAVFAYYYDNDGQTVRSDNDG